MLTFDPDRTSALFENARPTTLSKNEIIAIEEIIANRVSLTTMEYKQETNSAYPIDFYVYDRQYVAAIGDSGDKLVFVNFFCSDGDGFFNLKKELHNAADGGKCFFEIRVNITKKRIINYRFNGLGSSFLKSPIKNPLCFSRQAFKEDIAKSYKKH